MCVAIRLTRPKSGRVDRDFDRSSGRVGWMENKRAANVFEMSPNVSHHHVSHAKLRRGMPRLEKPFGHSPVLSREDGLFKPLSQ
jgi:hypothetical protein